MKNIILASASPRRRELMELAGFEFEIQVSHKEEIYTSATPDEIVKELSLLKAKDIAEKNERKDLIIIGADTVVAVDSEILGKPKSKEDATRMVKLLSGRKHQVYTGVAIISYDHQGKENIVNHAVCTDVYVAHMTDEEIADYVKTPDIMDKAGAYAIQGVFGAKFIEGFEGDYFNVVGLPIRFIYQALKDELTL